MRMALVVFALVACLTVGCRKTQQGTVVQGPIVSDGASFSGPAGWLQVAPDLAKTKGRFVSPGSDPSNPSAMIMIDIGRPADPDLKTAAEGMATNWGGRVVQEPVTLDGAPALRVRVDSPKPGLTPVEGVLCFRGGMLYMIMGGCRPGTSVVSEVEQVRATWKWVSQ